MRVLLTGATGFIGSHVARLLVEHGHHVTAVIKPSSDRRRIEDIFDSIEVVSSDVGDRESLESRLLGAVPDVCIHLAWHGWSGPSPTSEENLSSLASSVELLRALTTVGCRRFVGVGTGFEYEITTAPLAETTPTKPTDLYGVCKHAVFEAARTLSKVVNLEVAWARVFLVYGPFDNPRRLVPSLARSLIRGEPARVTRGEQVRDLMHVEDAASAIWALAESAEIGPMNIASGRPVRVADVADCIAAIIGRPELLRIGALPYREGEPSMLVADTTRMRTKLGCSPRYDLTAGLTQAIEWWKERDPEGDCLSG